MANKGLEAFDAFTAGLLAKIPDPDQRRRAEESITTLRQITPAAQAFGDGVAGQSEIDRRLQEITQQTTDLDARRADLEDQEQRLTTWSSELTDWYGRSKAAVEAALKRPNGSGQPTPTPTSTPPHAGVTEEQFNERIGTERAGFLGFSRDQNLITREHYTKFGEIVDLEPLIQHPQVGKLGLIGVYELVHKDRLDKWKTDAEKTREETIRADERRKTLESQASMPYPTPTGAGSGSPLDALAVGKPDGLADQAAAHYARLQAERNAAPGR